MGIPIVSSPFGLSTSMGNIFFASKSGRQQTSADTTDSANQNSIPNVQVNSASPVYVNAASLSALVGLQEHGSEDHDTQTQAPGNTALTESSEDAPPSMSTSP
jgi:hypothetical protein